MLKQKKNIFQIGHFTDTCRTSVDIRYVSDTGHAIDETCPSFIGWTCYSSSHSYCLLWSSQCSQFNSKFGFTSL